jgi:antitoxin ParD1/3/4
MSSNTMSFALPESLRDYIDARVKQGNYGNTSEYLRELVRRDQIEQENRQFRELIAEGLESGIGRPYTAEVAAQLRTRISAKRA